MANEEKAEDWFKSKQRNQNLQKEGTKDMKKDK